MEYKIPLRNKDKEIIDYTLVSQDYFDKINEHKWYKNHHGYVQSRINSENWLLHRFLYNLQNIDITGKIIDHINNNPLDNIIENLRIVTRSENNHNKTVNENSSSKYLGVCWSVRDKIWRVQKKINSEFILNCSFKDENHAAHQYDIWCKEYNIHTANLNNIDLIYLENFIPYIKKDKKTDNENNNIPKGITYHEGKYSIEYNEKIYRCEKLDEALIYLHFKNEEKILNLKINEENRLNIPIKRNNNGVAIIECFNRNKEKVNNILIDDKYYYEITKYKWSISKNYVRADIDKTHYSLHKFIFQKLLKIDIGNKIIDHINNNPLNNRIENLRIATFSDNAHNRNKLNDKASSKYIGVTWDKDRNKWASKIQNNKKLYNLGRFDTELEAAKKRDEFVIQHKLTAKLNIII